MGHPWLLFAEVIVVGTFLDFIFFSFLIWLLLLQIIEFKIGKNALKDRAFQNNKHINPDQV